MDELTNFVLNHLGSVMAGSGGVAAIVMAMIEISPIKINPWSQIAKTVGNAMNAGVMDEIKEIKIAQEETRKSLMTTFTKVMNKKLIIIRVVFFGSIMSSFVGLVIQKRIIMRYLILSGSMKTIVRTTKNIKTIECHTPSKTLNECMTK